MSSEGLMSSAEGLVPSASSSPILYVSVGERELLYFPYNRTHSIHLAVSVAKKRKRKEVEIERKEVEIERKEVEIERKEVEIERKEVEIEELEEEVAEYRQEVAEYRQEVAEYRRKKSTKDIKRLEESIDQRRSSMEKLRDHIRNLRDYIHKLRDSIIHLSDLDSGLLQMDICSQSKGQLQWSSPLEDDVIEEAQNSETPLFVAERCGVPIPKRMAIANPESSKKTSCKAPSDEVKIAASARLKSEEVPAYYHPEAVKIYDQFIGEPDIEFEVDASTLDRTVKHLSSLQRVQSSSNEYRCSSMFQVDIDRLLFGTEETSKLGACFGQYPVFESRRSDGSVYTYDANYTPERDILHYDYKKYDLSVAIKESLFYVISAHQSFEGYSWSFGLPCTCENIVFMMYLSGNSKVYTIELARVKIADQEALRKFLKIVYDAVHRRIRDYTHPQPNPFACMPSATLELRDCFMNHDSTRVFLYGQKAYKFYCEQDPNKKKPNMDLMKRLGYYNNLNLQDVGKNHTLLSYTVFTGVQESPLFLGHIDSALDSIAALHKDNFVHGDIREGNVLFSCTSGKAYLIDLDFADKDGENYPRGYNGKSVVTERHVSAASGLPRKFIHDSFSLMTIAAWHLPPSQKLTELVQAASTRCICSHCTNLSPSSCS